MAVRIQANGNSWMTYALIDTGATTCAINRTIAKKLGLKIRNVHCPLETFGSITYGQQDITSFIVTDINATFQLEIINAIVGDIMTTESEIRCPITIAKGYKHMKDINLVELDDPTVGLLLSTKFSYRYFGETRKGKEDEPMAVKTDFGWAVIGPTPDPDMEIEDIRINALCESEEMSIKKMINYIYRYDFIARPEEDFPSELKHNSQFDDYSLEQMKGSIRFNEETGHYRVSMPWKHGRKATAEALRGVNTLGYTRNRQKKLKEKLMKDPVLREGSFKQMREQIDAGYVKVIPNHSADADSPVCYLANHIVLHDDKPGKFRITQDAAAKVRGHRLNDYVLTGPDLLAKLISILFRFRTRRVVLSADIKSFFYQVEMDEKDQPACRFLWWADESMTKETIMQTCTYNMGIGGSPSVSNFTLMHHGMRIKPMFDLDIFVAIMTRFYMDDFLDSVDSVAIAKRKKENMNKALELGGFKLLKWKSNYKELNDVIEAPCPPSQVKKTEPGGPANGAGEQTIKEEKNKDDSPGATPARQPTEEDMEDESFSDEDDATFPETSPSRFNFAMNHDEEVGKISDVMSSSVNDKILGVGYDFERDVMFLKVGKKLDREINTKRELLSWISAMFDPLGIIAPYVLKGRLFFQRVNETGIDWNDKVPENILKPFNRYKATIDLLKGVEIPRWTSVLGLEDSVNELLICADASAVGYGIVCYVRRHLKGDNRAHVAFLMSKSHVVPLSMLQDPVEGQQEHGDSMPRLELNAARLAAIWRDIIVRESDEEFAEVIIFSDSLTVLTWIGDWKRKFHTFENFRLKKIRLLTKISEWNYIGTKNNPADMASKGLNADDSSGWMLFHNGPEFFQQERSRWEELNPQPEVAATLAQMNQGATIAQISLLSLGATAEEPPHETDYHENVDIEWPVRVAGKVESWKAKVRRVALVVKCMLRWVERSRAKKRSTELTRLRPRGKREIKEVKKEMYLTLEEKERGELLLIRAIQAQHFEEELIMLVKLGIFSPDSYEELKKKDSKLITLSPFLDDKNVLRAGGRLGNSKSIPYDSKYPIVLPKPSDENVRSLIRHIHAKHHHCSATETTFLLRQKFFVLGGRRAIQMEVARCVPCQRTAKLPAKQRMANLPEDRVNVAAPFCTSGADVFGPFEITQGRYTKKRWVLLITCFTTRAVALFALKDMTLSTTVNALVKMASLFPSIKKLVSDNGTNFKGANREIKEAVDAWNKESLNEKLSDIEISWEFGPANCGHWGGLWERIIQIVKRSIKASLENRTVDTDTFDTLLAGVMGVVNRRPITKAGNGITEPMVLTPAHFIYPYIYINSNPAILPPQNTTGEFLRSAWQTTREIMDSFWCRFQREYFQSLLERKKWKTAKENIAVDDIVLIVEDLQPREKWRTCRVSRIIGTDPRHVRRLELTDAAGTTFDRHVEGVVKLEISD